MVVSFLILIRSLYILFFGLSGGQNLICDPEFEELKSEYPLHFTNLRYWTTIEGTTPDLLFNLSDYSFVSKNESKNSIHPCYQLPNTCFGYIESPRSNILGFYLMGTITINNDSIKYYRPRKRTLYMDAREYIIGELKNELK
jgi:hypothetical protein